MTSNPSGLAKLGVLSAVVGRPERALGEVGDREVRNGIAARLEEQDGVVALDHGAAAELSAHPAAQRLRVQHALRHAGHQELPVGVST